MIRLKKLIYVDSGFYYWHEKILLFGRRAQKGFEIRDRRLLNNSFSHARYLVIINLQILLIAFHHESAPSSRRTRNMRCSGAEPWHKIV